MGLSPEVVERNHRCDGQFHFLRCELSPQPMNEDIQSGTMHIPIAIVEIMYRSVPQNRDWYFSDDPPCQASDVQCHDRSKLVFLKT